MFWVAFFKQSLNSLRVASLFVPIRPKTSRIVPKSPENPWKTLLPLTENVRFKIQLEPKKQSDIYKAATTSPKSFSLHYERIETEDKNELVPKIGSFCPRPGDATQFVAN